MFNNPVFWAILLCSTAFAQHRKLSVARNPGCGDKCNGVAASLIHVSASGPNDTLHHIWDFFEKPTIFLALTPPGTNLTVDWEKFLDDKSHSWSFSEPPSYIMALVIDKIIEYDDKNDTATFNSSTNLNARIMPSESFNWTWSSIPAADPDEATSLMTGTPLDANQTTNGSIKIKLSAYGYPHHGNSTPHLFHSTNATQLDVVFDQMPKSFSQTRYALELGVFNTNKDFSLKQIKSKRLNDEHSPGVFSVTEVLTSDKEDFSGYLQWRSVEYTSEERNMVNSSDTSYSDAVAIRQPSKSFKPSGVFAYFGKESNNISANAFIVNFGTKDDGYYGKTNYLSWSFLVGVGKPLEDEFSMLVWIILGLGLGLPAVLSVASILTIIARRIQRTRDQLLAGQ